MNKTLLILALTCISPVMAADFCMKYQSDIRKIENQWVEQSIPNMITFQAIKCHNNVLEYHSRHETPTENFNSLQGKDTTAMQQKMCSTPSIQKMAHNGLEKIVYIFKDKNDTVIDKIEISLTQCL